MTLRRQGFTLIEMLIVTVLGSLVLLATLQVLITNQRTYSAQNAVISGQQSTRMGLDLLFAELRQVSPQGGDILMMHSDSIRVRMMRKFSRACTPVSEVSGTPQVTVVDPGGVNAAVLSPQLDFAVGDSVFLYADNDEHDDDDDVWIPARITAVALGVCPQAPLVTGPLVLSFGGQAARFVADSVRLGAPVRSYHSVRFALVDYNGEPFLGRADSTDALQPVTGPLQRNGGLEFVYRDALGAVTATPADVRQIVVTLRSGSGVLNSRAEMVSDSITSWVYTRN
jgi:prepilin-type N-terminal cleavage/methylation domain-containing protein